MTMQTLYQLDTETMIDLNCVVAAFRSEGGQKVKIVLGTKIPQRVAVDADHDVAVNSSIVLRIKGADAVRVWARLGQLVEAHVGVMPGRRQNGYGRTQPEKS